MLASASSFVCEDQPKLTKFQQKNHKICVLTSLTSFDLLSAKVAMPVCVLLLHSISFNYIKMFNS